MPDGTDLPERLARGDASAFALLYDRHAPGLYRYLRAQTGRDDVAEDLLQALMLRLVRARRHLARVAILEAYLFAAARHEVARHRARRARDGGARAPLPRDPAAPAPPGGGKDPDLERALGRLAPARREVVTLHLHHDLTFAQIAEVLSIPANTAASRYRLALQDLRRLLETANAPP